MNRRRASYVPTRADFLWEASRALFPYLYDLKLRQHANGTCSRLVLGSNQKEPSLRAKQGLTVGCVGEEYFVVDEGRIEFGEREYNLITVLRLRQYVGGERLSTQLAALWNSSLLEDLMEPNAIVNSLHAVAFGVHGGTRHFRQIVHRQGERLLDSTGDLNVRLRLLCCQGGC